TALCDAARAHIVGASAAKPVRLVAISAPAAAGLGNRPIAPMAGRHVFAHGHAMGAAGWPAKPNNIKTRPNSARVFIVVLLRMVKSLARDGLRRHLVPCRFLVALPLPGDLFIYAKDLFVAARRAGRPKNDGGRETIGGRHRGTMRAARWWRQR